MSFGRNRAKRPAPVGTARTWAIACAPLGWPAHGTPSRHSGPWPRELAQALARPGQMNSEALTRGLVRGILRHLPEGWRLPLAHAPEAAMHLAMAAAALPSGALLTHDEAGQVLVKDLANPKPPHLPLPLRLAAVFHATWPGGQATWAQGVAQPLGVPKAFARLSAELDRDLGKPWASAMRSPAAEGFARWRSEVLAHRGPDGRWVAPNDGPALLAYPWGAPEEAR